MSETNDTDYLIYKLSNLLEKVVDKKELYPHDKIVQFALLTTENDLKREIKELQESKPMQFGHVEIPVFSEFDYFQETRKHPDLEFETVEDLEIRTLAR